MKHIVVLEPAYKIFVPHKCPVCRGAVRFELSSLSTTIWGGRLFINGGLTCPFCKVNTPYKTGVETETLLHYNELDDIFVEDVKL